MSQKLEQEIEKFTSRLEQEELPFLARKLCDYAYELRPFQDSVVLPEGKSTALTLMAVTHGNEVGGIGVLNRVLELLLKGTIDLPYPIVVALGNPWASRKGLRFVERDLNRSFLRDSNETLEDRRAKELEGFLKDTAYLIDFHQTIEPTKKPFFIFPYEEKGFALSRHLAEDIPIVTHWGKGFSKDGACTDEFVNRNGGVGISIELGQKGFDLFQEAVGLHVALKGIQVVNDYLNDELLDMNELEAEIYTWAEVIPYPEGNAAMDEGWSNFQMVNAGQRIGFQGDQDVCATASGPILFPKYIRESSGNVRPKELCRIMKRVSFEELGKG